MDIAQQWMTGRGWSPFPFQREAWSAYRAGRSGLVHAPTGMGKTLSVWLGPVAEFAEDEDWSPDDAPPPLRVLWITPLRALAYDTLANLRRPIDDLKLPWTVELRTGDVSSSVKRRQRQKLPTALVTTPESLSLLLSYPEAKQLFATLRSVIVDEWHELLGTKRGTQTELALARLRRWNPALRTWGLSATLGNLDEARDHLLGPDDADATLIRGPDEKDVELDILLPDDIERFPWAGHLGLKMLPQVIAKIHAANTSLIFTNTRSQCERWFESILRQADELVGQVAIHHGSLDLELRRKIEDLLRDGRLKAVVCTSSLDLGVDYPAVDQVMQVGSPKGVARLMQRAGRSGHQPGGVSRVVCVASHAFELMEFSAARQALAERRIEARPPVIAPLDLLAQHVVTIASGGGFEPGELFDEVRTAAAYRDLTGQEWQWVIDFVERGGEALGAYPQYQRITRQDGRYGPSTPKIARDHRLVIGTITADSAVNLAYQSGRRLGSVEESFASRLNPGDVFAFAGKRLEFLRLRDMTAYVRKARAGKPVVPRWNGSRFPLSTQLADAVLRRFAEVADGQLADEAVEKLFPLLELQMRWSRLPRPGDVLIENLDLRDGHHVFLFPFLGRLVHEGLAALLAHRLTRREERSIVVNANDYGIELLSPDPLRTDEAGWRAALSPDRLVDDLLACVNTTQLARRQFREIARIAGLIVPGFPGRRKTARHLQASSEMFFEVFQDFDAGNLLLRQAQREVLDRQLEIRRLTGAMEELARRPIVQIDPPGLTPLAFPLFADRLREQMVSTEKWEARLRREMEALEKRAAKG